MKIHLKKKKMFLKITESIKKIRCFAMDTRSFSSEQ